MRELTNLYHQGMAVLSSAQSVFEIIDEPVAVLDPGPAEGLQTLKVRPRVSFEGVTFGYDGGHRPALRDVSFELREGETLGVVGASGAGKSTLVWLMYRFYDPQAGSIRLDGHDLRELPLSAIRDNISVVTQDTYLFHGTVADNLRFGRPDATQAELEDAASAANAHDFISHLPHGYDTVVGERAVRLSGGQRQRLAIARALLKDTPILLLDEALSSVDAENESAIQSALDRLMENRTTLVIAHRLSSIINADRILVLDEGRAVGIGTHSELIAADGTYADLMRQQTQMGVEGIAPGAAEMAQPHVSSEHTPDLSHLSAGHGHHHPAPSRSTEAHDKANVRSLTVWMRLFGLVRPVKFQFLITLVLGMLHHGSVIILGRFQRAPGRSGIPRRTPDNSTGPRVRLRSTLGAPVLPGDMAGARHGIQALGENADRPLQQAGAAGARVHGPASLGRLRQRRRRRRRDGRVFLCARDLADDRSGSNTRRPARGVGLRGMAGRSRAGPVPGGGGR